MKENFPEKRISRREFIKKLGLVALGTIIGYSGNEIFEHPVEKENESYKSGEVIKNHVTPIKINKWRLIFSKENIDNYPKKFPNRYIRFVLIHHKIGGVEPELHNYGDGYGGSYVSLEKINNKDCLIMTAFPYENQPVFLHFTEIEVEEKGEKIIEKKKSRIRFIL